MNIMLQDINDPFSEFQLGPSTRVDARHRITSSGVVSLPYELKVAGTLGNGSTSTFGRMRMLMLRPCTRTKSTLN